MKTKDQENLIDEYYDVTRKLGWGVHPLMPKCIDDLSFVSRGENGPTNWFDVSPAKTDRWEVHRQYGRAMAIEYLDLINNPKRTDKLPKKFNLFEQIAGTIARTESECRRKYNTDGLGLGFFEVIGEYIDGCASR